MTVATLGRNTSEGEVIIVGREKSYGGEFKFTCLTKYSLHNIPERRSQTSKSTGTSVVFGTYIGSLEPLHNGNNADIYYKSNWGVGFLT